MPLTVIRLLKEKDVAQHNRGRQFMFIGHFSIDARLYMQYRKRNCLIRMDGPDGVVTKAYDLLPQGSEFKNNGYLQRSAV